MAPGAMAEITVTLTEQRHLGVVVGGRAHASLQLGYGLGDLRDIHTLSDSSY